MSARPSKVTPSQAVPSLAALWGDADRRAALRAPRSRTEGQRRLIVLVTALRRGLSEKSWYARDAAVAGVGCWACAAVGLGRAIVVGDWSSLWFAGVCSVLAVLMHLAVWASIMMVNAGDQPSSRIDGQPSSGS